MVGNVSERMANAHQSVLPPNLGRRAASGLVLALLALLTNWLGQSALAVMVGLVALVMSWEWGRLVRATPFDARGVVHAAAIVGSASLSAVGQVGAAVLLVAAGAVAVGLVRFDRSALVSACGVLYVGLPMIALIWLRGEGDAGSAGGMAILFLFVIVWATDTFAYLCGKLIGGPRLWPSLSPAKTWAGTVGGIVFAGAAALAFAHLSGHLLPLQLTVTGIGLSIAAQCGDLAESALKRAYRARHVSQLIPGHGGFMDRMDGVVAAAVVAAVLAMTIDAAQPARALLYWG